MNFFKSLKSRLLGSVKEDLNSALSGGRLDFNSKIEDALKAVSYTHLTLPTSLAV